MFWTSAFPTERYNLAYLGTQVNTTSKVRYEIQTFSSCLHPVPESVRALWEGGREDRNSSLEKATDERVI